jgi:hypothetical protein
MLFYLSWVNTFRHFNSKAFPISNGKRTYKFEAHTSHDVPRWEAGVRRKHSSYRKLALQFCFLNYLLRVAVGRSAGLWVSQRPAASPFLIRPLAVTSKLQFMRVRSHRGRRQETNILAITDEGFRSWTETWSKTGEQDEKSRLERWGS